MTRQHLPVYRVPWTKALDWLRSMVAEISEDQATSGHIDAVHGIPKGGVYPATILSVALDVPIVAHPDEVNCCLIVDDDAATGETLSTWEHSLMRGRHAAAVVHTRTKAQAPIAYYGAMEACPPDHRLLWPWREGSTPLPRLRHVVEPTPDHAGGQP